VIETEAFDALLVEVRDRYQDAPAASIFLVAALTAELEAWCIANFNRSVTMDEFARFIQALHFRRLS
jgi:hypothetical protein